MGRELQPKRLERFGVQVDNWVRLGWAEGNWVVGFKSPVGNESWVEISVVSPRDSAVFIFDM